MAGPAEVSRDIISAMVISGVRSILLQKGEPIPETMEERTSLTGSESALDSLGLLTLVVDLEETLEDRHGVSVILADGRPLSEENSSFSTVQSLTDRICFLIENDGTD